jgi:hypothetical protein
MKNNEEKYKQSFHTPFFNAPLSSLFGFKGLTLAAQQVLSRIFKTDHEIDQYTAQFLNELHMPQSVKDALPFDMHLTTEKYKSFWTKANENISCYPGPLSFATMKAGSKSQIISELECNLTRIPIQSGYAPARWRKCMDVMILKKSGVTTLGSLRTIVLFPPDCNYVFKHIGRELMKDKKPCTRTIWK